MSNTHGGAREGSGRREAHPLLKKESLSTKLPRWLLDKLNESGQNKAVLIETALREKMGWKAPDID